MSDVLKMAFEQHIEKCALVWDENVARYVFEQDQNGLYAHFSLRERLNDFQAGYELGKGEVK